MLSTLIPAKLVIIELFQAIDVLFIFVSKYLAQMPAVKWVLYKCL